MEMFGGPHDRPALIDDTTGQHQPPARNRNSVSVDHEGLLFVVGAEVAAPLHDRRPSPINDRYSVSSHLNQRTLGSTISAAEPGCCVSSRTPTQLLDRSTLPARLSKHPGMSAILIAAARLTNELDDRYINISRRRKSPEEHAPMTLRGLLRDTGQSHASKGIDAMAVQPFRSYTHAGFHPDNWDNRSP